MSTLRQMLPEDLLHYCESNRLVDGVLGRADRHDEQQPLSEHHRLEPSPHEVVPPHLSHDHHQQQQQQQQHPSDRRGNISIESSGRHGRMGLHEHHQPPHPPPPHALYHPYDHHPGRIPRRSGHPHQHPPPGPAIIPSSVSSSRRGIRDPYSY
jgi:hypothetical protein